MFTHRYGSSYGASGDVSSWWFLLLGQQERVVDFSACSRHLFSFQRSFNSLYEMPVEPVMYFPTAWQ